MSNRLQKETRVRIYLDNSDGKCSIWAAIVIRHVCIMFIIGWPGPESPQNVACSVLGMKTPITDAMDINSVWGTLRMMGEIQVFAMMLPGVTAKHWCCRKSSDDGEAERSEVKHCQHVTQTRSIGERIVREKKVMYIKYLEGRIHL